MKLTALVSTAVSIPFTVVDQIDGTPLSGLVDGDFTKTLIQDATDRTGAITVTITEVVSGRYVAVFTPDGRGLWLLSVSTPDGSLYGCTVDVGIFDTLERVRKESNNRHEIDFVAQTETAYDDDDVTPYQVWSLETDGGEPVTTQVGVQTKRGGPTIPKP